MDRRREIRDFLVSRRGRLRPQDAGVYVPADRVRRVPGLRREEVAELAGVSVDYYTQLERGQVAGASDAVLAAVAGALRLDDAERTHLFDLARAGTVATVPPSPPAELRADLQQTLDAFAGGAAIVRNRRWDYLGANALGRALYCDVFDGTAQPPNHMRYVFLDPRARAFFADWPATAAHAAQVLRSEAAAEPQDAGPAALVDELHGASAEFRAAWQRHDVRLPASRVHRFRHPQVGPLDLRFEAAALRADPGLTLLLATAAPGSPSAAALARLSG